LRRVNIAAALEKLLKSNRVKKIRVSGFVYNC